MEEDLIVERRYLRILEAGSSSHLGASFGCNRLVVIGCRPRGPQEVWVWVLVTLQEETCEALDKLAPVNMQQHGYCKILNQKPKMRQDWWIGEGEGLLTGTNKLRLGRVSNTYWMPIFF